MSGYAPDVTVSIPDELGLDDGDNSDWRRYYRSPAPEPRAAPAFPKLFPVGEASETLFGCSGAFDSQRYREATKFRTLPEMLWEEARIALNRLFASIRHDGSHGDYVRLAKFTLAASGFTGFVGKRGEHAVKLREGLTEAIVCLHRHLEARLAQADRAEQGLARPLPLHAADVVSPYGLRRLSETIVPVLRTRLPLPTDQWVTLSEATGDEAAAALDSLRETLAIWQPRRPEAVAIAERLLGNDLPSASAYAEAVHIADMLVWAGETLLAAYAGYMVAMPIYRLYPSTPEREAFALWWPWGRAAPLVDGPPPSPPKARKRVLDLSVITSNRPQDVVREVMDKTGINRTTAQRMTAEMRRGMRTQRQYKAKRLLLEGLSQTEVARQVGLSPSRISALFKGEEFARQKGEAIKAREFLARLKDDGA
jgi:hypothetical protein